VVGRRVQPADDVRLLESPLSGRGCVAVERRVVAPVHIDIYHAVLLVLAVVDDDRGRAGHFEDRFDDGRCLVRLPAHALRAVIAGAGGAGIARLSPLPGELEGRVAADQRVVLVVTGAEHGLVVEHHLVQGDGRCEALLVADAHFERVERASVQAGDGVRYAAVGRAFQVERAVECPVHIDVCRAIGGLGNTVQHHCVRANEGQVGPRLLVLGLDVATTGRAGILSGFERPVLLVDEGGVSWLAVRAVLVFLIFARPDRGCVIDRVAIDLVVLRLGGVGVQVPHLHDMGQLRVEAHYSNRHALRSAVFEVYRALQPPVHVDFQRAVGAARLDIDRRARSLEEQGEQRTLLIGAQVGGLRLPTGRLLRTVEGHFQRSARLVQAVQRRIAKQVEEAESVQVEIGRARVDAHLDGVHLVGVQAADVEGDDARNLGVVGHSAAQRPVYVDIRRATAGEHAAIEGHRVGVREMRIHPVIGAGGAASAAVRRAGAFRRGQRDGAPRPYIGDLRLALFPEAQPGRADVAARPGVNDALRPNRR